MLRFNTRHKRILVFRCGFLSVFLYSSHQFLSPPDDERLIRSKPVVHSTVAAHLLSFLFFASFVFDFI